MLLTPELKRKGDQEQLDSLGHKAESGGPGSLTAAPLGGSQGWWGPEASCKLGLPAGAQ